MIVQRMPRKHPQVGLPQGFRNHHNASAAICRQTSMIVRWQYSVLPTATSKTLLSAFIAVIHAVTMRWKQRKSELFCRRTEPTGFFVS
jgi:hypothetical protein